MNIKRKGVLTTGEVARICNVAPRTVSKWFDSGQLRGYRIPGSKDRRIPVEQLLRFMKAHGMPTAAIETGATGVVIVDPDREFANALRETLMAGEHYDVTIADSAFEAGVLLERLRPQVLVVDASTSDVDAPRMTQALRSYEHLADLRLIAIGGGLTEGQGQGLVQDGFFGFLRKPFEARQLRELIERAVGR
jgi:excisionase family DNA binding protein